MGQLPVDPHEGESMANTLARSVGNRREPDHKGCWAALVGLQQGGEIDPEVGEVGDKRRVPCCILYIYKTRVLNNLTVFSIIIYWSQEKMTINAVLYWYL